MIIFLILRHFLTVNSLYEVIEIENEGENIETWTCLVYLDKKLKHGVEIEFTFQYEPQVNIEIVRATTVQYRKKVEPCPICNEKDMTICLEYERNKEPWESGHAFLHECGLDEMELIDLVSELYMDDSFEHILTQENFDNFFIIQRKEGTRIYLLNVEDSQRYVVKNNAVYHLRNHEESEDDCFYCASNEFTMIDEEGIWKKCSVLSKNISALKKLIRNSNQKPIGLE